MDAGTGGNVDLLMRLMSASTERARVSSSNIANASTPGYRRQVVQFENILRERINEGASLEDRSGVQPSVVGLAPSANRHFGSSFGMMQGKRSNETIVDALTGRLRSS